MSTAPYLIYRVRKPLAARPVISVASLTRSYLDFADGHYRKNGIRTDEYNCMKSALDALCELYGSRPAAEISINDILAVRQAMVDGGKKCRRYINMSISRIRRAFRWAVKQGLLPAVSLFAFDGFSPLKPGETAAKDHPPRQSISPARIAAVKSLVSPLVADLMDLMLHYACKPGEILQLTDGMLDKTDAIWTAVVASANGQKADQVRLLRFGPAAQVILAKYITTDPSAKLFQISRKNLNDSIKRACEQLGMPQFWATSMRKTKAEAVRQKHGIDALRAMLGDLAVSAATGLTTPNPELGRKIVLAAD